MGTGAGQTAQLTSNASPVQVPLFRLHSGFYTSNITVIMLLSSVSNPRAKWSGEQPGQYADRNAPEPGEHGGFSTRTDRFRGRFRDSVAARDRSRPRVRTTRMAVVDTLDIVQAAGFFNLVAMASITSSGLNSCSLESRPGISEADLPLQVQRE